MPEYKQKQVLTVQLLDSDDMISKYSYYSRYEVKTYKYICILCPSEPLAFGCVQNLSTRLWLKFTVYPSIADLKRAA